jgi:sortase A
VHYPSTVLPGQNGNAAFFGHSSGNIFNNGKYKFAFTLLHDLSTGDLFYINYGGKTYAYRIFDRQIVPPTAVGVINDTRGKQATAELITCDPPGISTNRLVIWGEQISPSPTNNIAASPGQTTTTTPTQIPGNGPSLWSQMVDKLEFWN